MEKKQAFVIGAAIIAVIAFIFWIGSEDYWGQGTKFAFWGGGVSQKPEILFFEETPKEVLIAAKKSFPDYKILREKERHLARFLEDIEVVLAYDVQALPLLRDDPKLRFYPLYREAVVLTANKQQVEEELSGWQDLSVLGHSISMPEREPNQYYVWAAISYGLTGGFQREAVQEYLVDIYQQERLFWENRVAPIQIAFYSDYIYSEKSRKQMRLIFPREGTLSFQVGLLSRRILSEEKIAAIREVYQTLRFLSPTPEADSPAEQARVTAASSHLEEFSVFGEIFTRVTRNVRQHRRYAPINGWEHHTAALILIVLVVLWIGRVNRTVIHPGVQKGLILNGLLIIGWISVGVFKYSFYGSAVYIRALWYSYYLFILLLSPTGLYIAVNINEYDKSVFPIGLKIAGIISGMILLLVLTNDLHQQFFHFLVSDRSLWHKHYSYNWGFYLLTAWIVITQAGAWMYLLRKSWDSPKRKMAVLPILVLILGITYSTLYNLQVPFFREISLALGMSAVALMFWMASLESGLIPSNRGYHELFENSQLDMRIFDLEGKLRFRSLGALTSKQNEPETLTEMEKKSFITEEDSLIWSTGINGGRIVAKENIQELSSLKRELESLTRKLEEENLILSRKEQVESQLIFLKEQNELTEEVNQLVEDKIRQMKELLRELKQHSECREEGLVRLQRLALYCKRRCEMLIKSKQQELCLPSDISRLIDEINRTSSSGYQFFYGLDRGIPFPQAAMVYEICHLFYETAFEQGIATMTARLLKEKEKLCLYFLIEGDRESVWSRLREGLSPEVVLSYKELGDAFSVLLSVGEGAGYGRNL